MAKLQWCVAACMIGVLTNHPGVASAREALPGTTPRLAASPPTSPVATNLVQPESLPQGFIIVVTDTLGVATNDSPIYLASNHTGWSPNDPTQKLTPRSDRRWQIVLPKPKLDSRLAFKFTRGSWDSVETDANFADVENRSLPKIDASKLGPDEKPIIELTIPAFKDKRPASMGSGSANDPYREIKAVGTIRRAEVTGGGVPMTRDLLVWLPPGYNDAANAERRYPVLYLNDGQNVFEKPPTAPGEWQADETATALIAAGEIEPIIIVGIPHAGAGRMTEYVPPVALDGLTARGDAYLEFLVREVVPRVDRAFRTKPEAAQRAIGGSSLGGLISLYAGTRRSDVFGKVLAESVTVTYRGTNMLPVFEGAPELPGRVYLGVGEREDASRPASDEKNRQYAESVRRLEGVLRDTMTRRGSGADAEWLKLVVEPEGEHTESAWARRLPAALKFLFPTGDTPSRKP